MESERGSRPPAAAKRTYNPEIPLVPREGEFHEASIESLESFIESLESFSVRNESETCVRPPAADNRTFNHGIRLVPGEGELHEAYIESLGPFIESLESFSVRNESETCVTPPPADNRTYNH